MKWEPDRMLLYHVLRPYGGGTPGSQLQNAGLKKIARKGDKLILTFPDDTEQVVEPGETIPLPRRMA